MRARSRWFLALLVPVLVGCGARMPAPANGPGAVASPAAVERFLQLARAKDYVQMGWVFGTADGPIIERWPRPEIEQRMYALTTVVDHDSFVVGPGTPVPGRIGTAESFRVQLVKGNRQFQVPMTTVRGPGGRWFVEVVDVQAVTSTQ